MQREMDKELEDMKKNLPKDLVREYKTPEGGKVQEVGPLVYGYSMTIGPDGKPKVREFGNIKRPAGFGYIVICYKESRVFRIYNLYSITCKLFNSDSFFWNL